MSTIRLHIDELVLEGFDEIDTRRVGRAVERELTRLLASGAAISPTSTDVRDAGQFSVAPGFSPEALGARVAQSVHGGLIQ